ncbi:M20/M25/M40 family metallo-hydrolase [Roseivirga pacifica]|uniref:M20/M25/M40 family metallo-hydrolase n=1 Tax=Roseivirga pacifica TaxID=1267423 RepID=UPI0020956373|nr:M20/M25/M40 family metallo-hydrolase [Roseivirga pacifica]MCO6360897.1 M20/M25/M40 family metallo-hydrolase [Roseivirga pacifica]MCO6368786.1 M20/M25/M40 family metallo-hydrolase [Roseivirga pacifica]MCO6372930.1 M20/M25/M40 family metallo-hydrolase [Roseivirga pacifica]MCO6376990.1 M20/M25/M40 family metallo-hydrolase [Roseivirga pacifica]MCO6377733.1 M20/M25/M40 family metallo-hydrolase [Roseivirga pacifica]
MKKTTTLMVVAAFFLPLLGIAQDQNVIDNMIKEAKENSQLKELAYELLDKNGPRLVGTPQMKNAHDWAVNKYADWGIEARNEQWGEWQGWERGITHVDLIEPRVKTLEAMQLAWSPNMKKAVTAEVTMIPDVADKAAFEAWLPNVKGKFVLIDPAQPTGRPDYNWEKFGTEASIEKMQAERRELLGEWNNRIRSTGYNSRELPAVLEEAGAAGILISNWSRGFGVNKIFGARTKSIPTIDIGLEDYGTLFRMVEHDDKPTIRVEATSKDLGKVPTFNTIAEIKGTEKPDEYIILSAHFDSWDGGTGATDNGTGTLVMMEAMRILKKFYPNPKRTILVGLWGSEEQGLNGSSSFVQDNPEVVDGLQALFNQDNGTGRVVRLSGQGFLHAYEFLQRWMEPVPREIKGEIETTFPGTPGGGGSDYASFVAAGAPGFSLSSLSWDYFSYTWHTNRDTYDKIVFDDVQSNVILTAILTYMASEDPETFPRDRAVLPLNPRTGELREWPSPRNPNRNGGN